MSDKSGKKPQRQYARGVIAREEILVAAAGLFSESGFYETSLRGIAEKVGMTHPGLLHHFANKNDLLMAVLEYRDKQDREWMATNIDLEEFASGRLVGKLVELNASRPGAMELFTKLSAEATNPEHPAHNYFVERFKWVVRDYAQAFAMAQSAGLLRKSFRPEVAARMLVGLLDGLQLQLLLKTHRTDADTQEMMQIIGVFMSSLQVGSSDHGTWPPA